MMANRVLKFRSRDDMQAFFNGTPCDVKAFTTYKDASDRLVFVIICLVDSEVRIEENNYVAF